MQDPLNTTPGVKQETQEENIYESQIEAAFLLDTQRPYTARTAGFDKSSLIEMLAGAEPDLPVKLNLIEASPADSSKSKLYFDTLSALRNGRRQHRNLAQVAEEENEEVIADEAAERAVVVRTPAGLKIVPGPDPFFAPIRGVPPPPFGPGSPFVPPPLGPRTNCKNSRPNDADGETRRTEPESARDSIQTDGQQKEKAVPEATKANGQEKVTQAVSQELMTPQTNKEWCFFDGAEKEKLPKPQDQKVEEKHTTVEDPRSGTDAKTGIQPEKSREGDKKATQQSSEPNQKKEDGRGPVKDNNAITHPKDVVGPVRTEDTGSHPKEVKLISADDDRTKLREKDEKKGGGVISTPQIGSKEERNSRHDTEEKEKE